MIELTAGSIHLSATDAAWLLEVCEKQPNAPSAVREQVRGIHAALEQNKAKEELQEAIIKLISTQTWDVANGISTSRFRELIFQINDGMKSDILSDVLNQVKNKIRETTVPASEAQKKIFNAAPIAVEHGIKDHSNVSEHLVNGDKGYRDRLIAKLDESDPGIFSHVFVNMPAIDARVEMNRIEGLVSTIEGFLSEKAEKYNFYDVLYSFEELGRLMKVSLEQGSSHPFFNYVVQNTFKIPEDLLPK